MGTKHSFNEKAEDGSGELRLGDGQLCLAEEEVLATQKNGLPSQAAPKSILAYASWTDITILVVSALSAIIAGALNPLLTVIYGQLVSSIEDFSNNAVARHSFMESVSKFSLFFVYLAIAEFVFIYIATVGFYYTGEYLVRKLRAAYLMSTLRQNMAYFDEMTPGEVTTRITSDLNLIHEGVTSKLSLSITAASTFITAIIIGLVEFWKLGLILLSVVVAMTITGSVGGKLAFKTTAQSMAAHDVGIAGAEEFLGSMRHVIAYGIRDQVAQKYLGCVSLAEKYGIKSGVVVAVTIGIMHGIPYLSYGLSFWQGSRFVAAGEINASAVVTITLAIVIGAFAIGRVTPNAQAFVSSLASSASILKAISRQSTEDPFEDGGVKLENFSGNIVFRDVKLVYPSRPTSVVFEHLNLSFPEGKVTAIVGASGCGKSSMFGLIERFYQPVAGTIEIDGHNLRSLNLRWLRNQIAYIDQEPFLFDKSIFENIRHGLRGISYDESQTRMLVTKAATEANAHEFISNLPNGYDTHVGQRGLQLSGGQRQRIAIARALIGNPKIIMLDEATSALDAKTEQSVQEALENASHGRTVIIVAHRLTTIQRADNIIVMADGVVVEQGNHQQLLRMNGLYVQMVNKQSSDRIQTTSSDLYREEIVERAGSISSEDQNDVKTLETGHYLAPEVEEAQPEASFWGVTKFMLALLRGERWIIVSGLFFSVIVGLGTPVQSVFFAKLIDILSGPPSSRGRLEQESSFWCLMYLMLGIVATLARSIQGICFAYISGKLTSRARELAYKSILQQDAGYFEKKQNSPGALVGFLSTGTTNLNSLSGAILGSIFSFVATIVGGISLSLAIGWKLALVCTATIPLVAGCGWVRLKIHTLVDEKIKHTQEQSASYASEAVSAIKTVASLGLEEHVLEQYNLIVMRQAKESLKSILQASLLYAASQGVVFLAAALGFWYGGTLIASGEYTMLQFFICFAALISGSQSAGAVFSFAPDMSKATRAGIDLMAILNSPRGIEDSDSDSSGLSIDGDHKAPIALEKVSFRYPSRPNQPVLSDFDLSIKPGQYVALVGPSGCGKSTLISLLERFFEPTAGKIKYDGKDITSLNLKQYRKMISLVSQESVLYQGTIRENLTLGVDSAISEHDLERVCKEANIFTFIQSLPDGLSSMVGARGNLLSGGQKQRLAIARALIRNPQILLLDEATSALDTESEKVVQVALEQAASKCTTIAVAHRLNTIQKADLICVLNQGRIVEMGTHEELMAKKKSYFDMVQIQTLEGQR